MPESITLKVNDKPVTVQEGCSVAAAIFQSGITTFRRSVSGESRAALCGMGICFECRVKVNGQPQVRSCQMLCRNGMDVRTDE